MLWPQLLANLGQKSTMKGKIVDLFVNSKGGNTKYDYKDRRKTEANRFNKK